MLKYTAEASDLKPAPDHSATVFKLRLGLGTIFVTAVLFPSLYAPLLTTVWDYLRSAFWYRWSTFETIWTVFCYAAIEPYVTYLFMRNPQWRFTQQKTGHNTNTDSDDQTPTTTQTHTSDDAVAATVAVPPAEPTRTKPKGMRRPSRRVLEGLTYIIPLLTLDLTMIKKFADVSLEAKLLSGNYSPSLASHHSGHFMLPSVHNFSQSSPLQTQRALPALAPSSRRLALELVASFVIYDALFYLFHLTLHIAPLLKTWHNPHHTHSEMHPQITNQLSIFERLGLVLLANFSLNIIGAHVLTRTLFVPLFVWLLVEIHCGMDLPWGYEKVLPHGWAGGARKHALHHASGRRGLEPFFEWCDALSCVLVRWWNGVDS